MKEFLKKIIPLKKLESFKGEWWAEEIPPKPYENSETYLHRVIENLTNQRILDDLSFLDTKKKETKKTDWEKARPLIHQEMQTIKNKIPERMPVEILKDELIRLNRAIGSMRNPFTEEEYQEMHDMPSYFKETTRNRSFSDSMSPEKLFLRLFETRSLSLDQAQELFASRLKDKTLILFGGGDSVNDLLEESNLRPKSVINVDPYISSEPIDKNKTENYISLPYKAESEDLVNHIPEKANEIWATFSVPLYLEKTKDIEQLFLNIDALLEPGGICRIYPLLLLNFHMNDEQKVFTELNFFDDRRRTWVESVRKLLQTKRYNIKVFDESLLYIQKLAD